MVHLCGKRYAQRAGETTQIRVYSNQPTVSLYVNGKLSGVLTAEKVFVFTVQLEHGLNSIGASAGCCKDSMTIEKVDKEPEIYVLPEVNERAEGVANWFKLAGNLDLKAPADVPGGQVQHQVYNGGDRSLSGGDGNRLQGGQAGYEYGDEAGSGMWDMMKSMTPESMVALAGSMMPEGFAESLNAQLIKIDRGVGGMYDGK